MTMRGSPPKATHGRLTSANVWREIANASFAVVAHTTPSGDPRCSGVVYRAVGKRLYVAVAADSWKAKHIGADGRVAMTVPVRRGGILSLLLPIPPAVVNFHGTAIVHPAGSKEALIRLAQLAPRLPDGDWSTAAVIEIAPEGVFVTYGLGIPLRTMRDPAAAHARVPVSEDR